MGTQRVTGDASETRQNRSPGETATHGLEQDQLALADPAILDGEIEGERD